LSEFFSETNEKLEFYTEIPKVEVESIIADFEIHGKHTIRRKQSGEQEKKRKIAGEADFTCLINKTPKDTVKKILLEKGMIAKTSITLENTETANKTLEDYLKKYDFYNATLNLSVVLNNPARQSLIYARFKMLLDNPAAQILKIAPDEKGIPTKVKETGATKISVSPTLEMGVSLEKTQTDKKSVSDSPSISSTTTSSTSDSTTTPTSMESSADTKSSTATQSTITTAGTESSTKLNLGPKLGVTGSWSREKGYEITYDSLIKEVTGAIRRSNQEVLWQVTQAKLKKPHGNLEGDLISVPAFLIFWVQKRQEDGNFASQKINAKIEASGEAKENVPFGLDTKKEIEFIGQRVIELKEPI